MTRRRIRGGYILFLALPWLITLLAITPCAIAATSSNPYGMPSVARVLSTVQGKNALDTAARRVGVFDRLISMLADFEGPRQFNRDRQSPGEIRLRMAYVSAENRIVASVKRDLGRQHTSATGMNTPWAKWLLARYRYSEEKTYVTQTFLSAAAQRRYAQVLRREKASAQAGRNPLLNDNQPSAHTSSNTRHLLNMLGTVVFLLLYFTPLIIVKVRRGRYVMPVALLSLVFGFTGIGWLLGLVLAFVGKGEAPSGDQSIPYKGSAPNPYAFTSAPVQQPAHCSSCGGTGRQPCSYSGCRGGYLYTGGSSYTEYCPYCLGSGEVSCSSCGGSGNL